jgi:WhiB family redox-sensing transcriptional regulator
VTTTELAFEGFNQGACRTPDPVYGYDLHFPVSEKAASARQIARAKAVCASCPVLAACREYALASGDAGIWGGMTHSERRKVRAREQQRQREQETAQASDVDEPADEQQATLPSYQTARERLTRARRALDRARDTGDDAAIETAQAAVAAARQQLDDVRDNQWTDRRRARQAARNQLIRARKRLREVRNTGDQDAIREVEERIATAEQRLEATKVGNGQPDDQTADEAVA